MTIVGPLRVLVAEDNGDVANVLTRLLDDANLAVIRPVATHLAGLFGRIQRERIDVLVLDLTLEDCDEAAAVSSIAEMARVCAVVVVSATSNPRVAFQAREQGAETFISKTGPMAGVLERAVREAWHTWDARREAAMTTMTAATAAPGRDDAAGVRAVEGKGGERLWKIVAPEWLLKKVLAPVGAGLALLAAGWFGHAAATPGAAAPAALAASVPMTPAAATQAIDQRVTALEVVAQDLRVHLSSDMVWRTEFDRWRTEISAAVTETRTDVKDILKLRGAAAAPPPTTPTGNR